MFWRAGRLVWLRIVIVLALLLGANILSPAAPVQASAIPSFSILSVTAGVSVTIQTANFPPNQDFTVRMGKYGTYGIGGIVVATTNSGEGGSFKVTYQIPDSLKTEEKIAIRMDGKLGYYSFNWFVNSGSGNPVVPPSGYTGIPTITILSVIKDDKVTIRTNNYPASQTFTVRMGKYGTLGIGGEVVGTTDSGKGGVFDVTYTIPASLKGQDRIAIRLDSPAGYFSYNWFWNASTDGSTTPPATGYTGIPTFSITAVVRDNTVTIQTKNYPPNQTFTVRMGKYGTLGIGGVVVTETKSGQAGGSFMAVYTIPASLHGLDRIAIRMDSPEGYYSYNWFWNNTYP